MDELQSIIARLELAPLPFEGGWFRQYYLSEERDETGRPRASAIHFLMTPKDFSALHRLKTAETWTYREGATVELFLLSPTGSGRIVRLGTAEAIGEVPSVKVPGGFWQSGRTLGAWSLVDCRMEPAWDEREFELGQRDELMMQYPDWASVVRTVTRQK